MYALVFVCQPACTFTLVMSIIQQVYSVYVPFGSKYCVVFWLSLSKDMMKILSVIMARRKRAEKLITKSGALDGCFTGPRQSTYAFIGQVISLRAAQVKE